MSKDFSIDPAIFRDYDIRAIVPDQLDVNGLRRIAQAIIHHFKPNSIQVGHDMRTTYPELHEAFIQEMLNAGVDVVDLGFTSTDMLYFAAGKFNEDMAVNISASHNPPEYNGLKIVKQGAVAVGGDSGIYEIRDLALSDKELTVESSNKGKLTNREILDDFVEHVLSFIDVEKMKSLKVVVDTGNGMAGHFMPSVEKHLPWQVTRLFYDLDGTFPNHIPSPIELKNMQDTIKTVKQENADVGMAFDGDGDRVYLVDEKGRIVSGTIMTAIIADNLLDKTPNSVILYNAIIGRIVAELVEKKGGTPIRVRVGHALIKEAMREYNALFCGEHSGHYFFRENYYADSAIIAALLVLELMSVRDLQLSELLDKYDKYPSIQETNFIVEDKDHIMKKIEEEYKNKANSTDWLDGISVWFNDWWFNVRPSNTEPLLRLNVEADNDEILENKKEELVDRILKLGAELKE